MAARKGWGPGGEVPPIVRRVDSRHLGRTSGRRTASRGLLAPFFLDFWQAGKISLVGQPCDKLRAARVCAISGARLSPGTIPLCQ